MNLRAQEPVITRFAKQQLSLKHLNLSDYFAAIALQGMLASDSSIDRTTVNKAKWARVAYEFAEAMMVERPE